MDSITVTNVLEYNENEVRPILGELVFSRPFRVSLKSNPLSAEFQNGRLGNTNVHHKIYNKDKETYLSVETKVNYKGVVRRDPLNENYLVVVKNGEV